MTRKELKTGNNGYQIPLESGLRKVERNAGEMFDVAGVRFTWKVKGADTGYAFSIYQQELEPGKVCRSIVTPIAKSFMCFSDILTFSR
jgi:hypothetical protein